MIDKFCLINSGKYLFLFLEQEAQPFPSHLPPTLWETAVGLSTISEQLFDPYSLPSSPDACVPCSECIRCVSCPIFSEPGSLSPTIDKPKAHGSRSSCFCPFCQLKCSSITSNCRHLTEARLGTQKYLRSICCLVGAGLISRLSNTLKSEMLLELQIPLECLP